MSAYLDPEALVDSLTDVRLRDLQQRCAPHMGLCLLIDPMLGDPVLPSQPPMGMAAPALDALRAAAWQRACHVLPLPSSLALDAALAPYLVELHGSDDPWLAASVQWAVHETVQSWLAAPGQSTPHRVGGWLQSAVSAPQLAQVLSGWLQLNTQAPTPARYLRLADRRVLSLAAHVLGPEVMAGRLEPMRHWHWLDAQAAWRSLAALPDAAPDTANEARTLAASEAPRQPLAVFSHSQWAQMTLGETVHGHIAQSIRQALARPETLPAAQWRPVSAAQWQAALQHAAPRHKNTQEAPTA